LLTKASRCSFPPLRLEKRQQGFIDLVLKRGAHAMRSAFEELGRGVLDH
jgi:hypothetical protein